MPYPNTVTYVAVLTSEGRPLWQTESVTEQRAIQKATDMGAENFRIELVSDLFSDSDQ